MNKKWTKTILISMLAVLVMAIGAIGVFAQTDDAAPSDKPIGMDNFHGRGRGGFPGGHGAGEERQAELAEALGITVEELEAAQQEVRETRIAQLVEDGVLTLDQANLMLAMDALKGTIDRSALMAEMLDLSMEEFEAAREDGSLRDLLANTTPAEMQEKLQSVFEKALRQAVDDLIITADQAELIRENMGEGSGFGGHRGLAGTLDQADLTDEARATSLLLLRICRTPLPLVPKRCMSSLAETWQVFLACHVFRSRA